MAKKSHTSLPWCLSAPGRVFVVPARNFESVCEFYDHEASKVPGKLNAEFVVRACNSFYPMVDAINMALALCHFPVGAQKAKAALEYAVRVANRRVVESVNEDK